MPISNVKWCITTKKTLKPDTFRNFMIYIFDTFSESQAKLIANSYIGELGRKYTLSDHGFTCRDMDTAQYIWNSALAAGRDIFIDSYTNPTTKQVLFLVRVRTIEHIFTGNTSISRFVISQAILSCLNMIYDNWTKKSELYSINIDSIYIYIYVISQASVSKQERS